MCYLVQDTSHIVHFISLQAKSFVLLGQDSSNEQFQKSCIGLKNLFSCKRKQIMDMSQDLEVQEVVLVELHDLQHIISHL